jgi:single-stranded-DNA-specific exonuclease
MPRELSGLVAMRVSDKYQKPALVLMKDKNDNFSGSGRSVDESISFRDFIEDSDIAIFAEGHDSAFGVSFSEEDHIDDFLEYCDSNYQDIDSKVYVDFKINASDINLQLAENIVELQQYYGKGFESPTFYIEDFVLPKNNTDIIGKTKDTIKISYKDMEMIRFKDTNLVDKIENTEKDLILDLIGVIEVNEWRGNRTAQFVIEKYEIKGEKFSF